MTSSTGMKKEFLTKWAVALQMCSSSAKDDEGGKKSSVMLRKKAIKLSADVAMASTRSPSTLWSRALISQPRNSPIAQRLLGTNKFSGPAWTTLSKRRTRRIVNMNRKRKSAMVIKKKNLVNSARSTARRMVKKRTEVLRSLVPGGEDMEEWRLIKEALDYVVCLRVQVDVMNLLATATAAATASAGAANVYDDNPK